jgi:hypothetical protein
MARQHGVYRTAQALRLDSTKLMKRVRAAAPETKSTVPQPVPPAAFVEMVNSLACECVIEIEGPRGACASNGKAPQHRTWLVSAARCGSLALDSDRFRLSSVAG